MTIRELREKLGLSQEAFGKLVCASRRSVMRWEAGKQPDAARAKSIAALQKKHMDKVAR